MSNSPLVDYTQYSPNNYGLRTMPICRITPHCVVGQCTVESLGTWFAQKSTAASSNYGIGKDGKVGMYNPENVAAWCSSSRINDEQAVTIECASEMTFPYKMNDCVYNKLVDLCIDICRRNGKTILKWMPNSEEALSYKPSNNEMILTVHRWFAATACPGDWLLSRLASLSTVVTNKLSSENALGTDLYRVQVGAYRIKSNAESCLERVKAAGFENSYIVTVKDYFA